MEGCRRNGSAIREPRAAAPIGRWRPGRTQSRSASRRISSWGGCIRASLLSNRACRPSSARIAAMCASPVRAREKRADPAYSEPRRDRARPKIPRKYAVYDVREELEVMAMRIMPLPAPSGEIERLEALQRQHGKGVDAGDVLAVYNANILFHRELLGLCGNACLPRRSSILRKKCRASAPMRMPIPGRSTIRDAIISR